jgi:hypothetical protein
VSISKRIRARVSSRAGATPAEMNSRKRTRSPMVP